MHSAFVHLAPSGALPGDAGAGVERRGAPISLTRKFVSWADQIRRERRETAPWHYVTIRIDAPDYDPKR
jgi:hypothetical protein